MKVLSLLQHLIIAQSKIKLLCTKVGVQFTKSCLKQSNHIFRHKKIANIYIVYELAISSSHTSDPTIRNCLFGAVTLTKNADIEKYKFSGYGIGFDGRPSF